MQDELNDVDKEIESMSQELSRTPDDSPNLRLLLTCLGKAHNKRFDLLEEPDDINKIIEYTTIVLTLTPDDDQGMPGLLSALGTAHSQRFQRIGDMDDLEKGIEYKSLALTIIPDSHPDLARQLANLAVSHKDRFERLGELDDINKALEYDSRAVAVTPDDAPDLSNCLEKLGTSHLYRFKRLGELDDLEKAIECQSRGVALAPEDHSHLPGMLANLAASHSSRFERLGELNDLEQAIKYQSRALTLTPDGHPHLPSCLANLGVSHSSRFERLGELNDLEQAIKYKSRALTLTPDDHPHLPDRLAYLGVSHSYRFERLGELNDLEQAIKYESRALTLTPDGHPHLPDRLANLGVSHSYRFERLGELNDLEQAIKYESRALTLTPDGHPHLPSHLANLGVSHSSRFQRLGELNDLEKFIECQSCAVELTADNNPVLCQRHFGLAIAYVQYYEHTNNTSHLQDSLHSFRIASKSPVGAPRARFHYAHRWATHALQHSGLSCIEAYQATIDLLPQFIWFGATTVQRYEDLKMAATLATDAATAAILSSNYSLALEWLEHARCVVWNQNLMLRSPLDQLAASYPSLATHLQSVAQQLYSMSSESKESRAVTVDSMSAEQVGQQHRQLAMEYDKLLTQARLLPGLEDFLRPMKIIRLACAAHIGPIIVINCHKDRCDALVILPKQSSVASIPLPNFSAKKAQDAYSLIKMSRMRQGLRERGVCKKQESGNKDEFKRALKMLWNDLVKPTLDFLGYTSDVPKDNLPHVTWCLTGAASFLPLHAAGDYDKLDSRVFDYVISSYTPTLTALLASTPSTLGNNSQVLAIGQVATLDHKELPGTARELEHIRSHVANKAGYTQLVDTQATPSGVLAAMERHNWVHLACHAHQNAYDPTKSGFFLHGGTLDLASINRRTFQKKGLAYLSACQTATGDQELPDEAVHLASGMLMAGYSSVIATMWSVKDEDAPYVADKVYEKLMVDGKLGNGEAGKALHNAVAGLREKVGEMEFGRWVPYIHIGS